MPVYGDVDAIKALLRPEDDGAFSDDEEARIENLQTLASALIEYETGAVFGYDEQDPPLETRAEEDAEGRRLYLSRGVRDINAIVEGAEWGSGAWTGGVALGASAYRLTSQAPNGAYRIIARMDGGGWQTPVVISAVWEDRYPAVPAEIDYIANFLAAEGFKDENASPHGLMGPMGEMVPVREGLKHPKVRAVLERYRVGAGVLVV